MTTLRPLGATGLSVSPLCLGAMNFGDPTDPDESTRMIDLALERGVAMIDTADVYAGGRSEEYVGAALAANGKRDDIVLATKVGMPHGEAPPGTWHRREHIVATCDTSLRRLRTDHIDLLQLHRPSMVVPQEETLAAFDELVRAGKVRHVGCSTHPAWMAMKRCASPSVTPSPPTPPSSRPTTCSTGAPRTSSSPSARRATSASFPGLPSAAASSPAATPAPTTCPPTRVGPGARRCEPG